MVIMYRCGVNCQMCGDDPNVTCTCTKGDNNSYATTITFKKLLDEDCEEIPIIKPKKKKRMSRIQKQSMYGGK